MKIIKNMIGGIAGAVVLNILHETVRRFDQSAPRVDLVGEEALTRLNKAMGIEPPTGDRRYIATIAGDILSNAFYYSLIGVGKKKYLLKRGIIYGTAAGVGALTLTKPFGLSNAPITRTKRTGIMTIGYYLLGGVVAALTIKSLRSKPALSGIIGV